jgi:hypothetical protein
VKQHLKLFFVGIFFLPAFFCHSQTAHPQDSVKHFTVINKNLGNSFLKHGNTFQYVENIFPIRLNPAYLLSPVKPNTYVTHLGFFCQEEIKIEKFTNIPFRFRLGSLGYTNMLEGK